MFACHSKAGALLGRVETLDHAPHWAQFEYAIYERRGEPGDALEQLCYETSLNGVDVVLRVRDGLWQCSLIGSGATAIEAIRHAANELEQVQ
jgi:hypothetical protein